MNPNKYMRIEDLKEQSVLEERKKNKRLAKILYRGRPHFLRALIIGDLESRLFSIEEIAKILVKNNITRTFEDGIEYAEELVQRHLTYKLDRYTGYEKQYYFVEYKNQKGDTKYDLIDVTLILQPTTSDGNM